MRIYRLASRMVRAINESKVCSKQKHHVLRCHEIARAVGGLLGLPVVDGVCLTSLGVMEHSWLRLPGYTILDVYTPDRIPMVQLVSTECIPFHHGYQAIRNLKPGGGPIRLDVVKALQAVMRKAVGRIKKAHWTKPKRLRAASKKSRGQGKATTKVVGGKLVKCLYNLAPKEMQ